jgi:hypothetical protein
MRYPYSSEDAKGKAKAYEDMQDNFLQDTGVFT